MIKDNNLLNKKNNKQLNDFYEEDGKIFKLIEFIILFFKDIF